ncbi:glutamate--cysteine ligase [Pseudomonas oligotrophica]|uniref:glutamate--cysteine ligase n=1 Tax=Pseudomonas oligotrophica TaxID=2912055 RepID=UPI001F01C88C|nr:glutamate--cysteine ligase [Pseudomonas oligotrophica]MCF7200918.1 glutamate--cysteine ligase [Pseudomonas oligotrophica]
MSDLLSHRLAMLAEHSHLPLLSQCLHGIERECLRVDADGQLALTPHPQALGSALTHPHITTDYSEALLEFITGTATDPQQTLDELDAIHRFTYTRLQDELLWSPSMPCPLPGEADIPIAEYGRSNVGRLKHVYRQGLALRYGKTMQCIAGIHYNFSLAEGLWPLLQADDGDSRSPQAYQSSRYIALIRNFRRYSWLLMYLFGASPALDKGFLRGRPHQLEELDADTLYLPYATSLRMSDLGYQNNAQAGLTPCYDDLDSYTESLHAAVSTPYPPYAALGIKDAAGNWQQLNTNVLQIENEYYSNIRPKRVTATGERPLQALRARGIQYIEVRCLDINPFLPLGIDLVEARFLDAFLLFCALDDSPCLAACECGAATDNFLRVVNEGRRPGLTLVHGGKEVELKSWAGELLERIGLVAARLDQSQGGEAHAQALALQQAKVADSRLTPSAQVLQALRYNGESFARFAMRQTLRHAEDFRNRPLPAAELARFEQAARESLQQQAAIEAADSQDFDSFVADYQRSLDA